MFQTATILATLVLTAPTGASGCVHGVTGSMGCDGPICVGETIDCRFTMTHADQCEDSTQIAQAWAIVESASGDVRVPALGNLPIVTVFGNTTAVVGGVLPVIIGPPGSTRGLPGLPDPGRVTFGIDGYRVDASDPDRLDIDGWVRYQDFCDGPDTPPGCDTGTVQFVLSNLISVQRPCVADITGNCDVGFSDVLAILAAWSNAGGPEDVDGSGTVGFGDVLFVLGAWGACGE